MKILNLKVPTITDLLPVLQLYTKMVKVGNAPLLNTDFTINRQISISIKRFICKKGAIDTPDTVRNGKRSEYDVRDERSEAFVKSR